LYADNSLYVYQSASNTLSPGRKLGSGQNLNLLFAPDGALIAYDDSMLYDFSR
jgi:hypothetical protein